MSNPIPPSRFLGSFVARAILLVMALALLLLSERGYALKREVNVYGLLAAHEKANRSPAKQAQPRQARLLK
ncbi:MAG: hypothetical protein ABSB82_01705 [Terriglobia bacterium]